MKVKELFRRWAQRRGIEPSEELYLVFKGGVEEVHRQAFVIYGATDSVEFDLLLDDLSYWLTEDVCLGKGKSGKVSFLKDLETFCRAYVLMNLLVSMARWKKYRVVTRKRKEVVKKYKKKRIFLNGAIYFKYLCKRFGVLEGQKTRKVLIELAAKKKWWPLCAWDIAFSRPITKMENKWNVEKIAQSVPTVWKEEMENFVLSYVSKKKTEQDSKAE